VGIAAREEVRDFDDARVRCGRRTMAAAAGLCARWSRAALDDPSQHGVIEVAAVETRGGASAIEFDRRSRLQGP
jgi:hypothetical protein